MADDADKQLELDEDFFNPGPIRALSRVPSRVLQSDFRQWSQELEAAQEGDVDGEAAEAMRATQDHHLDELDLEEDLEFFMTGSPKPVAAGALPVTELPDRNSLLRSLVSQTVPPVSDFDSIEPAADSLTDERPSSAKKQKLASGDNTEFELEIENDFDFFDSRPSIDLKTRNSHNETPKGDSATTHILPDSDNLELEDDFEEMMRSNPPPPNQETSPSKSLDRVLRDDKVILSSSHIDRITTTAVETISSAEPAAHLANSPSVPDVASTSSSATAQALFGSVQRVSLMPITATTFEGRKIWLPRRQKIGRGSASGAGRDRLQDLQKQSPNLLDEPIYRMLDRIRKEKRDKQTPQASVQAQDQGSSTNSMNLWTDRYRPTKFIDLIGDERVFRNAMSWLKEWDQCVFKDRSAAAKRKAAKKRSAQAAFAASGAKGSTFNNPTPDPLGRPQEKVLLLCGAPGLGKTTMAHVLAHQAGYDIVEVNASDDRTTKVVTGRIKSALETRTLDTANRQGGGMTLKNNRPTCVIIDEIDGAAGGTEGGFVRALVKLITDGSTVKAYKAKSQKAVTKPLVRPIICICNDLYATALRPLRPIARIIRFNTPTPMTLIKRLKTICDAEKLKTDIRNLTFLVKTASGDLRSCLNTLQLVQSQTNVVSETAIKNAAMVGMKDIGASVQSILSKVFKLPKKAKEGETGNRLSEFIQDADACGEFKRIMQGCFESYLSAKHPTDLWGTYNLIHDWLHFYDQIDLKMQLEQIYGLTGYLPYTIAAWRELLGRITNIAPDYPKIDYEMFQKQVAYKEVADSFKQTMPPLMRVSFLTDVVITELIPLLMRIVSPDLRPVNSQLIRREERDVMMRVVTIMIELGLSFKLDKAEDGQSTFVLDPPIDLFTQFDGKRPQDIPPPRFGVRQMIAREMDVVLIKRNQGVVTVAETGSSAIFDAYKRKSVTTADKKEEKVAVDFFGRLVTETTLPSMDSQGVPICKQAIVLYRYHEGFSNAVKRPIKLGEFLQR